MNSAEFFFELKNNGFAESDRFPDLEEGDSISFHYPGLETPFVLFAVCESRKGELASLRATGWTLG